MKKKQFIANTIKYIILSIMMVVYIVPFLFVLLNSLKPTREITSNPMALPQSFDLSNFIGAFDKMKYIHAFSNSLIITVLSVGLIILLSSMTAYIMVRRNWPVTKYLFFIMIASMIIPFQGIMIPLVKIYGPIGFLNSKWALIYMYIGFGSSLAVFMFHGFIKSIPLELEEAASVDGASKLRIYGTVILPLLKPIVMTVAILDTLWIWNDFLLPSLVLINESSRTLPLSTFYFYGTFTADFGMSMASLILTAVPIIVFYLFMQKHIIDGVMQGSIK